MATHSDEFYDKEFTCGQSCITRGELESLPCPFCTDNVTDEQMQTIIDQTDGETRSRMRINSDQPLDLDDDKTSEVWWEQLEAAVNRQNIPYYEDID